MVVHWRMYNHRMDEDLDKMTMDELRDEVKKLRTGIRKHRDCSGHDLCWYHPELWELLPEKIEPKPEVPELPEFIQNCVKYRLTLCGE